MCRYLLNLDGWLSPKSSLEQLQDTPAKTLNTPREIARGTASLQARDGATPFCESQSCPLLSTSFPGVQLIFWLATRHRRRTSDHGSRCSLVDSASRRTSWLSPTPLVQKAGRELTLTLRSFPFPLCLTDVSCHHLIPSLRADHELQVINLTDVNSTFFNALTFPHHTVLRTSIDHALIEASPP